MTDAESAGDAFLVLARSQRDAGEFRAAAATFLVVAAKQTGKRQRVLEEAAACLLRAGADDEGARLLADAGLIPTSVDFEPEKLNLMSRLASAPLQVILRVLTRANDLPRAADIALAAWDMGDPAVRESLAFELPGRLINVGRPEDAFRVYGDAIELGLEVGDFRPRADQSTLSIAAPDAARRFYERDRAAFSASFHHTESQGAMMWQPSVDRFGGVNLRGATSAHPNAAAFVITSGKSVRHLAATRVGTNDAWSRWEAAADDLLPGVTYSVHLAPDCGKPSLAITVCVPLVDSEGAFTGACDPIGLGAMVVGGRVAALSAGARYRFEYGASASVLDQATPWADVPPPRSGRSTHLVYRQIGEWLPCGRARWLFPASGSPLLSIEAPFAKDRNQLNGIGAHEMPVGIAWSQTRTAIEEGGAGRKFAPVAGGVQDLRDAEITFTLGGDHLRQAGATLHFWISHRTRDDQGEFSSQWALTGAPFPDEVLADAHLKTIKLQLRNDPLMWTYTGNNPVEQGDRAIRYRRATLDTTLQMNNAPSVLIFAFGNARYPQQGALIFSDVEILYRDHSILSHAAGATLTHFPHGPVDPLNLTSGQRGNDAFLWTEATGAHMSLERRPLEFRWTFPHPVIPTHFQINQHLYWPARDIEITAEDASGDVHCVWRGTLAEGRPDRDEPPALLEYLSSQPEITAMTLRILSGYHPERCGLDGFEVYGSGAIFRPDGQTCSVSAEIEGLRPGARIFVRLVLEDGGERIAGEIVDVILPSIAAPCLLEAAPLIRSGDPACYWVRANAMGLETTLWGELEGTDGQLYRAPAVSLGSQPTGRHIYYTPDGIPDCTGVFRLCARNAAGAAVLVAPWPISGLWAMNTTKGRPN